MTPVPETPNREEVKDLDEQEFICKQCGYVFYANELAEHASIVLFIIENCENKHLNKNKIAGGQFEPIESEPVKLNLDDHVVKNRTNSAFQCKYCYNVYTSEECKNHQCQKLPAKPRAGSVQVLFLLIYSLKFYLMI